MWLTYKDKSMIDEACNLIIHHVKRQTSIHKEDKQKIKQLLRQFIPDLFATPRGELSDDEIEESGESEEKCGSNDGNNNKSASTGPKETMKSESTIKEVSGTADESQKESSDNGNGANGGNGAIRETKLHNSLPDDSYALFFVNNNWYLFFRLHNILCERLAKMYEKAQILIAEDAKEKASRKQSTAVALRLKPSSKCH